MVREADLPAMNAGGPEAGAVEVEEVALGHAQSFMRLTMS